MLTRATLRGQEGSALVIAMLVMLVVLPLGLALLSIVDTQASQSGSERTRDRAFNLADSALSSAAFSFSRASWPGSAASSPSNTGATGTAAPCGSAPFGATLGAATTTGSATGRLQPNLNASYDDKAYSGATWQINVCDDDPTNAGPTVWKDALLTGWNYDANANDMVWIRATATVEGHRRVLAALVHVARTSAISSKYGLQTGRLNSDLTNTAGTVLSSGLVGGLVSGLLGSDPLVAADTTAPAPASGVTAVRCGALDGCLTGALGATSALPLVGNLITSGNLVQATSPTAASDAAIAQFEQQAKTSNTYVATTAGATSAAAAPACTIPAGANANTIVYIDQVGNGDQFCVLNVSANPSYKALIIGSGRLVLRGNNSANGGTFTGFVYALNQQRATLGDAALPTREVIRIEQGAHVRGGVAADGKSAQVGIYPPGLCTSLVVLGIDLGCTLGALTNMLGLLGTYDPAIQANVAAINSLKAYSSSSIVTGSYRDLSGEVQ